MTESTVNPRPVPGLVPAALAGMVAAGAALAATELVAGILVGAPSVVLEIGALLISLQPAGAKQIVVDLFGTADKAVLEIAVVLGALALAAGIGIVSRRRPGLGRLGLAGIGILGLFASLRDPLVEPILALASGAGGVALATWLLGTLLRLATPSGTPEMPDWSRRRFIGSSFGLAGVAVVSGGVGRLLLNQRGAAAPAPANIPAAEQPVSPLAADAALDVPGISDIVTSNQTFYRIDTSLFTPRLEVETWQLAVDGMVDNPFTLRYGDLLAMPQHEQYVTIACVSNEVGGDLVGNALWKGVRLQELLDRAGVQAGATQVVGRSYDGWTAGFPTAWLAEPGREALVALAMNGEPLPAGHGFPARLIVPGLYGYVSATKWLTQIELTTLEAFDAYWVPLGWAKEAPILTQSRIDVPRAGASLAAGQIAVAGVAWAPDRGVSAVEVRIDDEPWRPATLSAPISDATWVQWLYRWDAAAGNHVIRVRATDGDGVVQTDAKTRPAPDGSRGHHTIGLTVR